MCTQIIMRRASGAARGPNKQASKGRLTRIRAEGAEPNRKKNRGGSVLGTSKELLGRPPVPGSPELECIPRAQPQTCNQPGWKCIGRVKGGQETGWDGMRIQVFELQVHDSPLYILSVLIHSAAPQLVRTKAPGMAGHYRRPWFDRWLSHSKWSQGCVFSSHLGQAVVVRVHRHTS